MRQQIILSLFSILWTTSVSYRILGVFPLNSRSHFIVFERLMKSLADRGHSVDVVSSFPQIEAYTNYSDAVVLPPSHYSLYNNVTYDEIGKKILPVIKLVRTERGNDVCHALGNKKFKMLMENPPRDIPYDAVITEVMIANCFLSIGHILNVPIIGVSTYGRLPWIYDITGNSIGFDFIPEEPYGTNHIDFWHRMTTMVSSVYQKWSFYHATDPQNAILDKYFGKKVPNLRELESNIAMILTNAHATTHGVREINPGIVEVGGMHVVDKYVPHLFWDIKDLLDASKDGVVYFNLGENLIFESLPPPIIEAIYKTFEKLSPMKFLMRISNHNRLPPGLPENVITVPWIQQLRVLQHENVRAFVTHGGLLGLQEAFYTGVPVVGIPLGGDQFDNVDFCVKKRIGVKLKIDEINENNFRFSLNTVLKNSTIRESMKRFSRIFTDRPIAPIETADYWVEYVIKHGSNALRSPVIGHCWYQQSNLDIYIVFFMIIMLTITSLLLIIRKIVFGVMSKSRRDPKMKKLL